MPFNTLEITHDKDDTTASTGHNPEHSDAVQRYGTTSPPDYGYTQYTRSGANVSEVNTHHYQLGTVANSPRSPQSPQIQPQRAYSPSSYPSIPRSQSQLRIHANDPEERTNIQNVPKYPQKQLVQTNIRTTSPTQTPYPRASTPSYHVPTKEKERQDIYAERVVEDNGEYTPASVIIRRSIFYPSNTVWCESIGALVLDEERPGIAAALSFEIARICYVTMATALLFLIIAILGIGKIWIDGFSDYAMFFTNWAWTLYGIYYGLATLGHICSRPLLRFTMFVLALTVNGVSWTVLAIVFAIIYNNPDILLDMISGLGGSTPGGLVLVMNCVFHPLAVIFSLVFILLHAREIDSTYRDARLATEEWGTAYAIICGLWITYSPILMLLIYMTAYDPTQVYGYQVLNTETALAAFVICTIFNGVPYVVMSYRPHFEYVESCERCGMGHERDRVFLNCFTWWDLLTKIETKVFSNGRYPDLENGTRHSPKIERISSTTTTTTTLQQRINVNSRSKHHVNNNSYGAVGYSERSNDTSMTNPRGYSQSNAKRIVTTVSKHHAH